MRCVGTQCGWLREERRCRMVVPFASRSPKQTPHFDPTRRERPIAGALRRCRFADWHQPTALATPSTASRNRPFALMFYGEQALLLRIPARPQLSIEVELHIRRGTRWGGVPATCSGRAADRHRRLARGLNAAQGGRRRKCVESRRLTSSAGWRKPWREYVVNSPSRQSAI